MASLYKKNNRRQGMLLHAILIWALPQFDVTLIPNFSRPPSYSENGEFRLHACLEHS